MATREALAKRIAQLSGGAVLSDFLIMSEGKIVDYLEQSPAGDTAKPVLDFMQDNRELFPLLVGLIAFMIREKKVIPKNFQYVPEGVVAVALLRALEKFVSRDSLNLL
ncbi:MAG: hypothetical protein ACOCRX_03260 [Candidatus Woesearchaeota archaeon]